MSVGSRNRRGAPLSMSVALAALAIGANGALAGAAPVARGAARFVVAPETPPSLGEVAGGPLLEALRAPRAAARDRRGLGAFALLARSDGDAPVVGLAGPAEGPADAPLPPTSPLAATPPAAESLPPPVPTRSASPAPDPRPTALAAALAGLIMRDGVNPLGDGDWRAARAAIGAFYADRSFQPVWVGANGLTRAGRAALARLERASEDGLDLSALALPREVGANLAPNDLAAAETTIAEAVVTYAEQASGSRLAPSRVSPLFASFPRVADPGAALAETAAAPDPGARLADFNPPQKGYRDLREKLMRLRDSSPVSRRRAALDLSLDVAEAPLVGDDVVPAAGPQLDAPRGPKGRRRNRAYTASAEPALVGPSARQRAAILANMEMWRWEPRDMGERRIEVNIPDFSIEVREGDAVIHSARVVVGKPKTPTPVFSNVMRYVLINPSWRVPDSIIKKEILPRLDHFTRLGFEVKTVGGRITVRQPPGEDNALGRIAFMFPNDHSVYLHDTPAQELFSEDMRALSHGCVRVEEASRLAELVLGWPESRVSAAVGGAERTVFLPQPLPIHIEYFTEFVDDDGILQERPDVYGLTQKVAATLSTKSQD